jgi:hypothetical protein
MLTPAFHPVALPPPEARAARQFTYCVNRRTTILLLAGSLFSILPSGCASHQTYSGPVHGLRLDGTVQSLDLANRTLTLAPFKPGAPMALAWDANTKFWKNGVPAHAEELEAGASIRIHYHTVPATHCAPEKVVAHHVYIDVPYAPEH